MQAHVSRRSTVLLAALFSLVLLTGSAHSPRHNEVSRRAAARSALAAALGPARPVEGRLTGFPWAPFVPSRSRPSKDLLPALRDLQRSAAGSTPEDIAARALAELAVGKIKEAVGGFDRAVAAAPAYAALFSDLAAAYLEDARKNREPYSLVKALESAEKAVVLDPNLPEARFNRALALESLFLDSQARLAWGEYLRLDPETPWRLEAESRLKALGSPDPASRWTLRRRDLDKAVRNGDQVLVAQTVSLFPQAAREYAEEKLLGDWAEAWAAGRSDEARRTLAVARAIGGALEKSNGEKMPAATVDMLDRALTTGGGRLTALVEGHRSYQKGLHLYNKGRFAEAGEVFARAEQVLQLVGSPFADWARFRLAVCQMQLFHYERALALLDRLQANTRISGFRSLKGRARWVSGLILGILARPAESLAAYRSSLLAFAAIGERENLGAVSCLMAEGLRDLGDLPGAWRFHLRALQALRELREPARRQVVLEQASATALRTAEPLAAISFLQEALAATPSPANSAAWFYCLRRRALACASLGRMAEAQEDLRKARAEAARFPDSSIRGSFLGDFQAVEGKILATQDPRGSFDRLSAAIRVYENTQYQQQLALLYAERARSSLALDRPEVAERDFDRAIEAIHRQRKTVVDDTLRASYLEEFRSVFEDMVGLQARLGHEALALDYAESARARVLFELEAAAIIDHPGKPLNSEEIRKHLPKDVAVLEYSVLPQRLLIWVIRRDSLKLVESRISAEKIQALSEDFRSKILKVHAGSARGPDAEFLFDLLIGDLQPALEGVESLVVIPDRSLYGLPFAALWDPSAGEYLIERYSLSVAPSANFYIRALVHVRRFGQPPRKALVIGNPRFDRELLPQLSSLPHAEREAKSIAALYPETRLLLGEDATRKRFLEGLDQYDMVHVAGHAVSNRVAPLSSFLALAPAAGDSGILYARDLYPHRRARVRLIVLSACSGLSGDNRDSEGVVNLARPFLAMGVPAVIGSLWSVDDRATKELLTLFHQYFRSGVGATAALRQAQIEMSSSSDPTLSAPAFWAGFQLLGAGEP
ncbi:MAG TPA: CHAT domain-containing protein [Thermoanaerobaculia bacterium]|jgi:CHAT domain-containing protein|nr:CHAT domain-containing protein [Thermoanaerobaculia bacterium]